MGRRNHGPVDAASTIRQILPSTSHIFKKMETGISLPDDFFCISLDRGHQKPFFVKMGNPTIRIFQDFHPLAPHKPLTGNRLAVLASWSAAPSLGMCDSWKGTGFWVSSSRQMRYRNLECGVWIGPSFVCHPVAAKNTVLSKHTRQSTSRGRVMHRPTNSVSDPHGRKFPL